MCTHTAEFRKNNTFIIYKGDIVEVATAEELFDYPLHPYTRSLISAIPIPDPLLEKHKKLFTYDPSVHDYSNSTPSLVDIGHGHFVFGDEKEIEEYRRIRESGERIQSITILSDEEMAAEAASHTADTAESTEPILETPPHDTGNVGYSIGSFFLPIIGLIGGGIFKRHRHIRNYKACKKGGIAGLIFRGAVLGLFLLALGISLL